MDAVIAKGVLATFFIGCCPQLRVPEQRLAVLLSKEPDIISGFDIFYSLVLANLKDIFDE